VGDTVKTINLAGVSFQGSSYTLDVSSLPTTVAKLPPFRTLILSADFDASANDVPDGELVVSVSGTGQIMRFGSPSNGFAPTSGVNRGIITAMVPIVANAPTKITFAKGSDGGGGVLFGTLQASIFDFDLQPFTTQGFSA